MSFEILPATTSDIPQREADREAIHGYPVNPITQLLYNHTPPSAAFQAAGREGRAKNFLQPDFHHYKAVINTPTSADTDAVPASTPAGTAVAWASWQTYTTPIPADAFEKQLTTPTPPSGVTVNVEAWNAIFELINGSRRKYEGQGPHIAVRFCVTNQAWQRRGAGTALMGKLLTMADELGLPVVLESSVAGKRLYEKCGFKLVDVLKFDRARFGGEGVEEFFVMRRDPETSTVKEV